MNVEKEYQLGEKNFVEKHTFAKGAINYNSTVTLSDEYYVVAEVEGKKRQLNSSTGSTINEPVTRVLFASKRKDPRSISVFFVAKHSYANVTRGSHSMNKNLTIPSLQYEITYLAWDYRYSIVNPITLTKNLSGDYKCYYQSLIDKIINDTITIDIETILSRAIDSHSYANISSFKQDIREEIEESIKEKIITKLGVSVEITNIEFQEDETIKQVREGIQVSNEIKKSKGE